MDSANENHSIFMNLSLSIVFLLSNSIFHGYLKTEWITTGNLDSFCELDLL